MRSNKAVSLVALLVRPLCWPRWLRRAALLLLPVAIAVWLLVILLVPLTIGLAKFVAKLWGGEQRHLHRTSDYSYPDYRSHDAKNTRDSGAATIRHSRQSISIEEKIELPDE